jgi:hypothetical protein
LNEGAAPEDSVAFLGKKFADSDSAALGIARRFVAKAPGIVITGPNGVRWDLREILRRLQS